MDVSASTADTSSIQPVVTLSASYGAGGSVIGPALAERLHLPFVDRLLSADISQRSAPRSDLANSDGGHSSEELTVAEETATPTGRLFSYLAWGASGLGTVTASVPTNIDTDDDRREWAEAGLDAVRGGAGAVILGRAAAILLAERPRTFHVRLDGPAERRDIAGAILEGIPEASAAERRAHTDHARELWAKRLYHADVTDPSWYHLRIDTTVLPAVAVVVDLIELAFAHYVTTSA